MTSGIPVVTPTQTGLDGIEYGEGLEHSSVKTWDRAAVFVTGVICAVGLALMCTIQFAYAPAVTAQLFVALPPVLLVCLLLLLLLKNWLGLTTRSNRKHATRN